MINRSAQFDRTGQYRYRLDRWWNGAQPAIALIMLNPSRADHQRDDPTLRRCIGLAQQWQYGSLIVVNLFAYCTPFPKDLKTVGDPVGAENDAAILQACQQAPQILLAWGNGGSLYQRDLRVLELLTPYRDRLYCLGINRTGQPRHPLYIPRQAQLHSWVGGLSQKAEILR
ncbi:MAG: DUF1643 domain-containing protein [Leptolyngbya sp. SIO1E4]|nr:DUF1643 domain-containing protein [Leptolyngbya sp. SIO1E4]